ncbi:trehalose operon repressor [Paenibacillus sediminis]|uniref:Trehalose operon repressor n=1 Tax=Paenibacillus sediminis TaxID=664909 RepID=A0ABS4H3S5_9BACL|nr:trehalose operon repressor [Paenibacillus sediminis]MBP1937185.1 GntR family trehalose operon transcriptional repressor [Paenibacillus sediminis]
MRENIYLTIYRDYADKIQSGQLKPQTKLPSESELMEEYGISRETVRKALNLLSQNGYIQKIKGKGSFVLDVGRLNFPVSGLVSFKELTKTLGKPSRTIVYETELIKPDHYIKQHLQCSETVWKVVRAREIEGERIILDKDYFDPNIVPMLTKEITGDSIYDYLEHELKLKISFAKKEISVEQSIDEDRKYMDLHDYLHVVVVRNYVYLEDATLFQYTESRHRLDKFRFIDFARRGN